MQGVSLCARCGVAQSSTDSAPLRRSRRAVLLGLLSSGLLAKVALGAAALAAVGGVAATMASTGSAPTPVTAVAQPLATTSTAGLGTASSNAQQVLVPQTEPDLVHQAEQFAAELEVWGECVAEAARAHSGEAFDPEEACGETPKASDHGLGTAHAPGLHNVDGETIPAAQTDKVANPNKPVKSDDGDDGSAASKDKADKADKSDDHDD